MVESALETKTCCVLFRCSSQTGRHFDNGAFSEMGSSQFSALVSAGGLIYKIELCQRLKATEGNNVS